MSRQVLQDKLNSCKSLQDYADFLMMLKRLCALNSDLDGQKAYEVLVYYSSLREQCDALFWERSIDWSMDLRGDIHEYYFQFRKLLRDKKV